MGSKKVSDLVGSDIKIGADGKVAGTVNYIADPWTEFDTKDNTGHFFPFKMGPSFKGKPISLTGSKNGVVKTVVPDDLTFVSRLENLTANKLDITVDGKDFALDFTTATLAPPLGKDAVSVPEQTKDFGAFGKASTYIADNVTIDWDGNVGTVNGTINYVDNAHGFSGDEAKGNYFPLVLGEYFSGKEVSVNAKTENDTEWIVYLGKLMKTDKRITVKLGATVVAILDFSKATLSEAG